MAAALDKLCQEAAEASIAKIKSLVPDESKVQDRKYMVGYVQEELAKYSASLSSHTMSGSRRDSNNSTYSFGSEYTDRASAIMKDRNPLPTSSFHEEKPFVLKTVGLTTTEGGPQLSGNSRFVSDGALLSGGKGSGYGSSSTPSSNLRGSYTSNGGEGGTRRSSTESTGSNYSFGSQYVDREADIMKNRNPLRTSKTDQTPFVLKTVGLQATDGTPGTSGGSSGTPTAAKSSTPGSVRRAASTSAPPASTVSKSAPNSPNKKASEYRFGSTYGDREQAIMRDRNPLPTTSSCHSNGGGGDGDDVPYVLKTVGVSHTDISGLGNDSAHRVEERIINSGAGRAPMRSKSVDDLMPSSSRTTRRGGHRRPGTNASYDEKPLPVEVGADGKAFVNFKANPKFDALDTDRPGDWMANGKEVFSRGRPGQINIGGSNSVKNNPFLMANK